MISNPNPATRSGSGPSDAALVLAASANESWAKEALFRRYAGMVNRLAYRLLGRDSDLDDLVQDSFAQAWRSLGRLQAPQAFGTWLGSIVVRTANKMLRRRRLQRRLGLLPSGDDGVELIASSTANPEIRSELRLVYGVLERLPTAIRIAFVLRRIEGLSTDEVAEMMKISIATVKRHVAFAEQELRARSEGEDS